MHWSLLESIVSALCIEYKQLYSDTDLDSFFNTTIQRRLDKKKLKSAPSTKWMQLICWYMLYEKCLLQYYQPKAICFCIQQCPSLLLSSSFQHRKRRLWETHLCVHITPHVECLGIICFEKATWKTCFFTGKLLVKQKPSRNVCIWHSEFQPYL